MSRTFLPSVRACRASIAAGDVEVVQVGDPEVAGGDGGLGPLDDEPVGQCRLEQRLAGVEAGPQLPLQLGLPAGGLGRGRAGEVDLYPHAAPALPAPGFTPPASDNGGRRARLIDPGGEKVTPQQGGRQGE
jgi:hypothetical protein